MVDTFGRGRVFVAGGKETMSLFVSHFTECRQMRHSVYAISLVHTPLNLVSQCSQHK